jgi:hypothetical protein
MRGLGRYLSFVACGLALFGLYAFLDVVNGIEMWDECWFLQVVHRVTSGDVLYRDVFFNVTPLSVYLTAVFTGLFGSEVLVLKAIMALIYISIVLVSCRILYQVSSTKGFSFFFAVVFLTLSPPWLNRVPYSPLANLFFLVCFSAALSWMRNEERTDETVPGKRIVGRSTMALAIGGIAAGLSFASKQNIGVYALTALLFTVVIGLWGKREIWRKLPVTVSIALASFCLVSALGVLPVSLSGGWTRFLDYGFMNRATYLQFAGISYFDGIKILMYLVSITNSIEGLIILFTHTLFLWPFLVLAALLIALIRKPGQKRLTAAVAIFAVMGFLGVFPRADLTHLAYAVPELLIGLIYSWKMLKPSQTNWWVKAIQGGIVLWVGMGMVLILTLSVAKIKSSNYGVSTLPHFRKVLIEDRLINDIKISASALSEAARRGERPFLISPRAGLFYLVSGTKNPTPFDYPLATAFGRNGQEEVISGIAQGSISCIWVDPQILILPRFRPTRLLVYLRTNMKPGEKLGIFTPYRFH